MMKKMDFLKRWESRKDVRKPKGPLRPQIEEAIKIITIQIQKLDLKSLRIKDYDKALFEKVVTSYRNRDTARAKIFANELTEVRKLAKMIYLTRLALEQISVRLNTVKEYGDVAANVAPALEVMNKIYGGLTQVVPEADSSAFKLNDLLESVLVDATQYTGRPIDASYASEEGMSILKEAASAAEAKLSKTLPDLSNIERNWEMQGF